MVTISGYEICQANGRASMIYQASARSSFSHPTAPAQVPNHILENGSLHDSHRVRSPGVGQLCRRGLCDLDPAHERLDERSGDRDCIKRLYEHRRRSQELHLYCDGHDPELHPEHRRGRDQGLLVERRRHSEGRDRRPHLGRHRPHKGVHHGHHDGQSQRHGLQQSAHESELRGHWLDFIIVVVVFKRGLIESGLYNTTELSFNSVG